MSPFSLPFFPVCWVPGEYITTVSFFPWVCLIHYQKFLLIKWDCIMVPRAWHGPPPALSWWQRRTSQLLTPVASPGRGGRGGPSCWICAVTRALIFLGALFLFPFGGTWPASPGPAFLPLPGRGKLGISSVSWRLDLDIHHAEVSTPSRLLAAARPTSS